MKEMINEIIYLGFGILLVLQFIGTTKMEDLVILVLMEITFIGTKLYCKEKKEGKFKKRFKSRKNDRS